MVRTTITAHTGGLDRLTVHDAPARLWIAPLTHPFLLTQSGMGRLPGPIESPGTEVVIHRLPGAATRSRRW